MRRKEEDGTRRGTTRSNQQKVAASEPSHGLHLVTLVRAFGWKS